MRMVDTVSHHRSSRTDTHLTISRIHSHTPILRMLPLLRIPTRHQPMVRPSILSRMQLNHTLHKPMLLNQQPMLRSRRLMLLNLLRRLRRTIRMHPPLLLQRRNGSRPRLPRVKCIITMNERASPNGRNLLECLRCEEVFCVCVTLCVFDARVHFFCCVCVCCAVSFCSVAMCTQQKNVLVFASFSSLRLLT